MLPWQKKHNSSYTCAYNQIIIYALSVSPGCCPDKRNIIQVILVLIIKLLSMHYQFMSSYYLGSMLFALQTKNNVCLGWFHLHVSHQKKWQRLKNWQGYYFFKLMKYWIKAKFSIFLNWKRENFAKNQKVHKTRKFRFSQGWALRSFTFWTHRSFAFF